jgi:hypothetical protein
VAEPGWTVWMISHFHYRPGVVEHPRSLAVHALRWPRTLWHVGTIQEPDPDRDWLKRSYPNTGGSPFTVESQAEMMGRLAEGTGTNRMARVGRIVFKTSAWIILASIFLAILANALNEL